MPLGDARFRANAALSAEAAALESKQLATDATTVVLIFTPPPPQGVAKHVAPKRMSGINGELSNTNFAVNYVGPLLATMVVLSVDFSVFAGQAGLDATSYGSTASVPTAGRDFIQFRGANLGVLPTFAIGRNCAIPPLAPAPAPAEDCSAPAGAFNCWREAVPAEHGSGAQFASKFGVEGAGPSIQVKTYKLLVAPSPHPLTICPRPFLLTLSLPPSQRARGQPH